jgi:hypothetical protein
MAKAMAKAMEKAMAKAKDKDKLRRNAQIVEMNEVDLVRDSLVDNHKISKQAATLLASKMVGVITSREMQKVLFVRHAVEDRMRLITHLVALGPKQEPSSEP